MSDFSNEFSVFEQFSDGMPSLFMGLFRPNDSSQIIYTKSIESVTGMSIEEINQFPEQLYSLIPEEDFHPFIKNIREKFANPNVFNFETEFLIKPAPDRIIWLKEYIKIVRDKNGLPFEVISLFVNNSELKSITEESKIKIDKYKELNQAKDKFISIVSHDLRAPFTTLLGFSEILVNEKDIEEEERNEYLGYIYDSSKTQLSLINNLLDWSRLQTGRVKVEPQRLHVKSIISNALSPISIEAARKRIELKFDIPNELYMNADERLISQTIINLVSNAIKFSNEGSDISISASKFKEGMLEFIVKDDGVGISEENQSKLFQIDQKFSLPGTDGQKGSGLGLTLAKEIIDQHNGYIWFYSQEGIGSEFHFTIPEAKNIILLIEHDKELREHLKEVIELNLSGFEIIFSNNGYEAISKFKTILPTLIITDHDMPLMNGIQLVEAINSKDAIATIPIIVILQNLTDELTARYDKLGISKIVTKPVNDSLLLTTIQSCLN